MAPEQQQPAQQHEWRKVGWTTGGPGRPHRVYEALVPLRCHNCGRTIQPGERFSRVRLTRQGNYRRLFCRTCLPVEEA
jgi:hypothetical protein